MNLHFPALRYSESETEKVHFARTGHSAFLDVHLQSEPTFDEVYQVGHAPLGGTLSIHRRR